MADPKLLRVLKKLTELLEEINPDNPDYPDCAYDLRGRVYRGRSVLNIRDAREALSILEFPRHEFTLPVGEQGIVRNDQFQLMLQGWPTDDAENPSDPAYTLKAFVERHLSRIIQQGANGRDPPYPDNYLLGKVDGQYELTSFAMLQGVVRPPEDTVSRLAMFYLPLVLGVRTDLSNPF